MAASAHVDRSCAEDGEQEEQGASMGRVKSQRPTSLLEAPKNPMAAVSEEADQKQRREDKQRQAQLAERKRALKQFMRKNGFNGVNDPKRVCLLWTSYPLHAAVQKNNLRVVEMLLAEGANPAQKNSSGLTPAQVAEKKNKKGSHGTMLQILQTAAQGGGLRAAPGGA